MNEDSYDILHQRIDTINRQLDAIMDTIQQMAKVIQLLQPKEDWDVDDITPDEANERLAEHGLPPMYDKDGNKIDRPPNESAVPDAEFITEDDIPKLPAL